MAIAAPTEMELPMKTPITLGLVSALALAGGAPAFAQYAPDPYANPAPAYQGPYAPTDQYQRDMRRYENDRADYQAQRLDYQSARRTYERQRDDYERARAAYDVRYGYGAYARIYGPAPAWDEARWANAPSVDPYRAGAYGRDASYSDPCRDQKRSSGVAGGLIGALAGAALGSNVAARNARTEGAVLGAVVGGAVGVGVGRASAQASAKCDARGYYFNYDETVPYRESRYDRRGRSGQYDYRYYARERCRLAPAPVDWGDRTEYRYVRVCPDPDGRYRVTG